jgi:hypothetical protein
MLGMLAGDRVVTADQPVAEQPVTHPEWEKQARISLYPSQGLAQDLTSWTRQQSETLCPFDQPEQTHSVKYRQRLCYQRHRRCSLQGAAQRRSGMMIGSLESGGSDLPRGKTKCLRS